MSKYNQTTTNGESWQRANKIIVDNDLGGMPSIRFQEEVVTQLADGSVTSKKLGVISESMNESNASTEFELYNPLTGEVIPQATSTYQDVQVLLYSLYMHLAISRDRGPSPYPSWSWDEPSQTWSPPMPKPSDGVDVGDGIIGPEGQDIPYTHGWSETNSQWVKLYNLPPQDGNIYIWDENSSTWTLWDLDNM